MLFFVLFLDVTTSDSNNAKAQGVVNLVKSVNSANGKIIDGIGTQSHLSVRQARPNQIYTVDTNFLLWDRPVKLVEFRLLSPFLPLLALRLQLPSLILRAEVPTTTSQLLRLVLLSRAVSRSHLGA
jgi:hypothetical protein